MSNEHASDFPKVERRYQGESNFLQTQLNYSQAAHDFNSVKRALTHSKGFHIGQAAFQFAWVEIETESV